MLKKILTFLLFSTGLSAQNVAINDNNANPDPSAMLDVQSTNKGMLVPRMTTAQRTAIANPAVGLLVFDSDFESFWFRGSSGWIEVKTSAQGNSITTITQAGGDISGVFSNLQIGKDVVGSNEIFDGAVGSAEIFDGAVGAAEIADGTIGATKLAPGLSLPPNGPAGKDLSGTYPDPTVAQIQGQRVSSAIPQQGQVMMFDNGQWKPLYREIAILEERTDSDTGSDGGPATSNFMKRKLNIINPANTTNISLNSNDFTFSLREGTYIIQASAPAYRVNRHQLLLRTAPAGGTVLAGTNEFSHQTECNCSSGAMGDSFNEQTTSYIYGFVTVPANTTQAYQLDTWVQTTSSNNAALGWAHSGLGPGTQNIYCRVIIEKIQ